MVSKILRGPFRVGDVLKTHVSSARSMRKLKLPVVSLLILFAAVLCQAQASTDVRVKLIVVDNKTASRIGKPIRLALEFTADAPGYNVETIPDMGHRPIDTISISPETGINHWFDEMIRGYGYARDVFTSQKLSTTPIRVPITLNSMVRFEQPGRY